MVSCQQKISPYIIQACIKMQQKSQIEFQKYSTLKNNLVEDSESEDETNKISQIVCQLLPAYYQYRKYLIEILRQSNANHKMYASLFIPQEYVGEKLRKCREEKSICEERRKNQKSAKVYRSLVTDKVIQKQRKKVAQQKQLYQKYEAQEIDALIQKQYSSPKFPKTSKQRASYSFEQKNQFHSFQNINKPVMNQMLPLNFCSSPDTKTYESNSKNVEEKNKKTSILNKSKEKIMNFNKIINDVKASIREENQGSKDNSVGSSKVIEKVQNSNLSAINAKSDQSEIENEDKPRQKTNEKTKNTKQDQHRISSPKIRINYKSKETSSQQSQSSEQQSQLDDDFISQEQHHESKPSNNNIVQVQHNADDTYSEHKGVRPYIRHNTPNFDTFSQKVRPNNFYEIQKQKLQVQKQKAERLQNQISVVLGEESVASKKSKNKNRKQEYSDRILDELEISKEKKKSAITGRLSTQEIADQFLFTMRYMLTELCELYCHSECLKYLMKNKQYQILKILCQQQLGKGPIFAKAIIFKIQEILKEKQKKDSNIIIRKIFRNEAFVDFDEFGKAFSSSIMPHQFNLLNAEVASTHKHNLTDMVSRLFLLWLQIDYFENKIKKNAQTNSMQKNHLTGRMTNQNDETKLDFEETQKFLYSTTKNRTNSSKIRLFLNKYFPAMKANDLNHWLEQKIPFK